MGSRCASKDSCFVQEATINRRRIANRAPCSATHAQQPTTQLLGEASHRIDAVSEALEPFARPVYARLHGDALVEHGGLAVLYSEGGSINATFATPNLRANSQIDGATRLRGILGWRHASCDAAPTSTHRSGAGIASTLEGVPLAKHVAVVKAGVERQLQPNLKPAASCPGQYDNELQDHGFKVDLNWTF